MEALLSYDVSCIVTSVVYMLAGAAGMATGENMLLWTFVTLSGIVSVTMRALRLHHVANNSCRLTFGNTLCNPAVSCAWVVDMVTACVLAILVSVNGNMFSSDIQYVALLLSVVAWITWAMRTMIFKCKVEKSSHLLHTLAHVVGCIAVWNAVLGHYGVA